MARRTATRSRRPSDDMPDEERFAPEEDLDDEDAPRSRRGRSSRDDEDDDAPRGRGRSRSRSSRGSDDDEPRRSSRSRRDEDDEEDESPRGSRRGRSSRGSDEEDRPRRERGTSTKVGRGWGAVDKIKFGDYVDRWPVPEKPTLIKFLEPEPFTVYAEHFIEEMPKGSKKSYVCLGDDCPLCDDLGDVANSYAGFNILDLSDPDNPKSAFLRASGGLAKEIRTYASEERSKPINRWDVYFAIHRKQQKGARYKLELVKARDLEEDWDMVPFDKEEVEDFDYDLVTEDQVVFINTRKDLKDVVSQVDEY